MHICSTWRPLRAIFPAAFLIGVIEDTDANYVGLLNLIRGYNYSLVGPWKGSFPHSVLELHCSKTWMFRESAASYRHLILQMYTYF
jgi:hypothetical protein